MKRVEVELIGEVTNATVVRLPGRRFPGIVIQGDSLAILASAAERALKALGAGRGEEASEELQELVDLLGRYRTEYEKALGVTGLELPYVKSEN